MDFLKRQKMNGRAKFFIVLITVMLFLLSGCASEQVKKQGNVHEGWKLAIQAWTFHEFTFCETVDKAAALGLKYIEVYPGQKFSKEKPGAKFDHNMSDKLAELAVAKFVNTGVQPISYGVISGERSDAEWRRIFEFAKRMGIETIGIEQPAKSFDLIEKLCVKYGIRAATHNHPKPSSYWHPDMVLKVCKGRSKLIGVNADVGHWVRSGLCPVDALRKLEGRVISIHLKDVKEFGEHDPWSPDVVYGTGAACVDKVLTELDRQGFKGVIAIEHENDTVDKMPEVRACIEYYNKIAGSLASK